MHWLLDWHRLHSCWLLDYHGVDVGVDIGVNRCGRLLHHRGYNLHRCWSSCWLLDYHCVGVAIAVGVDGHVGCRDAVQVVTVGHKDCGVNGNGGWGGGAGQYKWISGDVGL